MIMSGNTANRKNLAIFIFVVVVIVASIWGIYASWTSCSKFRRIGSPERESFVSQLWPKEDSVISIRCYQKSIEQGNSLYDGVGVGVTLLSTSVDKYWQTPPETPIPKRASLYLNDRQRRLDYVSVPVGSLKYCEAIDNCVDTGRPYSWNLSWSPPLSPGKYDAQLIVESDSGEFLEYSWSFIMTD